MIKKYEKYLDAIEVQLLKKYFEQQKDYIHCKQGCSYCCEKGEYPFSELEFKYAMIGYNSLNEEKKSIIDSKAKKIKEEKTQSKEEVFMYECPFLIDKKCSIYNHRGLICRTHGLMFYIEDENGESKNKAPHCMEIGLNYSSVFDKEKKVISQEMWDKSGIKTEPVAYNLSKKALFKKGEQFEINFGESKALIDWF